MRDVIYLLFHMLTTIAKLRELGIRQGQVIPRLIQANIYFPVALTFGLVHSLSKYTYPQEYPVIEDIPQQIKSTWLTFVEDIEPLRPALFRFSLQLTGNPFDAEDLVHDGMLKAFGVMAMQEQPLSSPRGFLLKTISNLWIDSIRRSKLYLLEPYIDTASEDSTGNAGEIQAAIATLITQLNPREQVIVLLSQVFEMSQKEIAGLLSSTEGTVKVALHRARAKLKQSTLPNRAPRDMVERFVAVFQTHDLEAIKLLFMEEFEAEVFPNGLVVGRDLNAEQGWLHGCLYHHIAEREAGKDPYPLQLEVREVYGEHVVLVFRQRENQSALEEVWRFEAEGEELVRVRDYGFSPDLVSTIAEVLDLPFRAVGYQLKDNSY
jgi:RNA polymerase sigma factor (sigma-70 family)